MIFQKYFVIDKYGLFVRGEFEDYDQAMNLRNDLEDRFKSPGRFTIADFWCTRHDETGGWSHISYDHWG